MDKSELAKALEIAERWKTRVPDHMKDTVSGAIFEEMGILSRALLSLRPEEQPVSDLVLDFARGIVGAEGFYTQAAVTVARELLRISGREPQKR